MSLRIRLASPYTEAARPNSIRTCRCGRCYFVDVCRWPSGASPQPSSSRGSRYTLYREVFQTGRDQWIRRATFCFSSYECCVEWAQGGNWLVHGTLHACARPMTESPNWAMPDEVSQVLEETLVSYRLFFGQSKTSRRLFRSLCPFDQVPTEGARGLLDELRGRKRCKGGREGLTEMYNL